MFFKTITVGKSILLLLSPILTLILSMKTTLLALAIIITIDTLTGIRKSLHQKDIKFNPFKSCFWKALKSSGLRSTWRKTYEYGIGIVTFAVMDSMVFKSSLVELFGSSYSIAELAVVIACMIEIYSIYENMEAVSGNNLFKRIIRLFPERLKKIFRKEDEIRSN